MITEIEKARALKIIVSSAELYNENLNGHNLLILCKNDKSICHYTMAFQEQNFLHLTGMIPDSKKMTSFDFYRRCINRKLSTNDFKYKSEHTTKLKLDVLTQAMEIHKKARNIGEYGNTGLNLFSEILAGTENFAMGFIIGDEEGRFYPNTVVKEDIRELLAKERKFPIIAILRKSFKDELYNEITYLSININRNKLKYDISILNSIEPILHVELVKND